MKPKMPEQVQTSEPNGFIEVKIEENDSAAKTEKGSFCCVICIPFSF